MKPSFSKLVNSSLSSFVNPAVFVFVFGLARSVHYTLAEFSKNLTYCKTLKKSPWPGAYWYFTVFSKESEKCYLLCITHYQYPCHIGLYLGPGLYPGPNLQNIVKLL